MSALIKYDQARQALAACRNVDEIKDIRDKSEAMRLYAKQAQDTELEQWAAEIKLRAQRAIGEISVALEKQKNQTALPTGGKSKSEALADAGISTSTANRYEKLAAIPEPVIEEIIAKSKEIGKPVSAKAVMAQVAPKAAPPSATPAPTTSEDTPREPSLVSQVHEQQVAHAAGSDADDADSTATEVDPFDQLRDDYDAAVRERDELRAKVDQLNGQVAFLTQDDMAAEAQRWKANFEGISGRNAGLTKKLNELEPEAAYMRETLQQIRQVLGVERNSDIVPALKSRRAA